MSGGASRPASGGADAVPEGGPRLLILMCHGPSCSERGSPMACARLREALAASPLRRRVRVSETNCLDRCATGPNVVLADDGRVLTGVLPDEVERLLDFAVGDAPQQEA
jgi:NADH:ubiquinone oxidoreductase subunit E